MFFQQSLPKNCHEIPMSIPLEITPIDTPTVFLPVFQEFFSKYLVGQPTKQLVEIPGEISEKKTWWNHARDISEELDGVILGENNSRIPRETLENLKKTTEKKLRTNPTKISQINPLNSLEELLQHSRKIPTETVEKLSWKTIQRNTCRNFEGILLFRKESSKNLWNKIPWNPRKNKLLHGILGESPEKFPENEPGMAYLFCMCTKVRVHHSELN